MLTDSSSNNKSDFQGQQALVPSRFPTLVSQSTSAVIDGHRVHSVCLNKSGNGVEGRRPQTFVSRLLIPKRICPKFVHGLKNGQNTSLWKRTCYKSRLKTWTRNGHLQAIDNQAITNEAGPK